MEEEQRKIEEEKKKNVEFQKFIPITSLSSFSVSFSDNRKIKREGNLIIHNGNNNWESCILDKEMKKVNC